MKHRFSFILASAALLGMLTLGGAVLLGAPREARISDTENRMLQGFPSLEGDAVLSGRFMEEFEQFLSDGFPRRDRLVGLSQGMLSLLGEKDEEYELRKTLEQEEQLQAAADEETGEALPLSEIVTPPPAEETAAEATAAPETEGDPDMPAEARDAALWLVKKDGSRTYVERYPAEKLAHLAPVLNQYRDCLPPDGKLLFLNMPVTTDAHAIDRDMTRVDWGYNLDEALQPLVEDGVVILDGTDILRPWLGKEDLYPLEDHHWHAQAASHAADAMAEELGLPPAGFYDYMYRLELSFREDPVTPEQLMAMQPGIRNRRIPVPTTPVESYVLKNLRHLEPTVYLESDKISGYGIYLGGLHRPWRLFETGYHTGRTALVIGDSFYHALLPYLTPYYDRIISTDLRDGMYRPSLAGWSIRKYMEEYKVDDVYMVMCRYTSVNNYVYQNRLDRYLNTDYGEGFLQEDEA